MLNSVPSSLPFSKGCEVLAHTLQLSNLILVFLETSLEAPAISLAYKKTVITPSLEILVLRNSHSRKLGLTPIIIKEAPITSITQEITRVFVALCSDSQNFFTEFHLGVIFIFFPLPVGISEDSPEKHDL